MGGSPSESSAPRFGALKLDLESGEVYKNGTLIKLQPQPFKVLALLARHAGQLVTREEIQQQIWGSETFVDFEKGLNFCIKQIRAALGDDAETPHYIETLPKRGYRFIAAIEKLDQGGSDLSPARRRWVAALAVAVVLLAVGYLARQRFWLEPRPAGKKIMLAVLPFQNMSGDAQQDYLSEGLTEEMITQLARFQPERLGVIARTSVMRYKLTDKPLDQVGRELGVDYILEGSVHRENDRVRVNAQLIRVRDQTHLWAESYNRDVRDILALQGDVSQAVARQIELKLTPEQHARLANTRPVNPEAYQLYLKGRYFLNKQTEEGLKKAQDYFRQAIDQDPNYALAYSGLADSYIVLASWAAYIPPREGFPKAKAALMKALEIDDTLAEAHAALAFVKERYDWDQMGADKEYKRALELDPGSATVHSRFGAYLGRMGQYDEAIAELRRALELDPLSLYTNVDLGNHLFRAGQYDQGLEQLRSAVELDQNYYDAHVHLGEAYAQKRMFKEAIAEGQKALMLSGGSPHAKQGLARTYALAGKRAAAKELLAELERDPNKRNAFDIAVIHMHLGEKEQALAWLEKAYKERTPQLTSVRVTPAFSSLRDDPRFQDLVRRVGATP